MRWRRPIRIVLIFGVLGAIVNLTVAWGFVYWTRVPSSMGGLSSMGYSRWPVPIASDWPGNAVVTDRWVGGGVEIRSLATTALTIQTSTSRAGGTAYAMDATYAGWPLLSFAAARADRWDLIDSTAFSSWSSIRWGLEMPSNARSMGMMARTRLLPLYPVIPGFIVNAALYGLALWLLWALPLAVVRWRRRRRRGLCTSCGYDLRGAAHERCPECGAAIAAAQAAG